MGEQPVLSIKRPMSRGTKVRLIALAIGGFCCLCIGAIAYCFRDFRMEGSQDPTEIEAARNNMAKFHLPPGFMPVALGKIGDIRFVGYMNPAINGRLQLIDLKFKSGDRESEVRNFLAEQDGQSNFGGDSLLGAKRQSKQIKIKGKECTFEFTRGTDPTTNKVRRRVSGTFEGNSGPTMIQVDMDESAYKENEIVTMLANIQ